MGCKLHKSLCVLVRLSIFGALICLHIFTCAAQNLVGNPSFEEYSSCPNNTSQVYKSTGWNTYSATPDYFHSCGATNSSVPNNSVGFQCGSTGISYCGMHSYHWFNSDYREFIGRQLDDTLIVNQKYYVSFKVVLAEGANCASDNLGVLFSTKPKQIDTLPNDTNWGPTNNFTHFFTDSIISDTASWVTVFGSFVSDSNYTFLTVGNFFNDANTSWYTFDSSSFCLAYYYIDDICVSTDSLTCADITKDIIDFSVTDTTVLADDCVNFSINTLVNYNYYQWQFPGGSPALSNDTAPLVCYSSPGVYDVTLIASDSSTCGDTIVKTGYITVLCPPPVVAGFSSQVATGIPDVTFTDTSTGAFSWLWDFGDGNSDTVENPMRAYDSTGTYNVCLIASNACDTDTFCQSIIVSCAVSVTDTVVICNGDSVMVGGGWQTLAGTYFDTLLSMQGCDSNITTLLVVNPMYGIADPPVTICNGDSALVYGTYKDIAGTYYDTLTTVKGCDSVRSTVLAVNLVYSITDPSVSICGGDSVFIYGMYRTVGGTYYDSLTTINGCDSVRSTVLAVNPAYSIIIPAQAICDGDSAMIFNIYRNTAGTYYDSSITAGGCDSIVVTSLSILPDTSLMENASICGGDSIFAAGAWQSATGIYIDSLISTSGCDSIRTTALTVNPLPSVSFSGLDGSYCSTASKVTLTGTPPGGLFSGTGGVAGNQFFPATGVDSYTVTYAYTDSMGCFNSVSQNVSVVQCIGISESSKIFPVKVYPNPAKDKLFIVASSPESFTYMVYDLLGAEVMRSRVASNYIEVDVSELETGIYFIEVAVGEQIRRVKFAKE